jgi:hypothetical protein
LNYFQDDKFINSIGILDYWTVFKMLNILIVLVFLDYISINHIFVFLNLNFVYLFKIITKFLINVINYHNKSY